MKAEENVSLTFLLLIPRRPFWRTSISLSDTYTLRVGEVRVAYNIQNTEGQITCSHGLISKRIVLIYCFGWRLRIRKKSVFEEGSHDREQTLGRARAERCNPTVPTICQ